MKHVWSTDTVYSGRSGRDAHEWIMRKCSELERKTGVKWSCESAHGKLIFNPYMRKEDAQFCDNDVAEMIVDWLNSDAKNMWYRSILDVAEGIGVSLPEVCGTCWMLARESMNRGPVLKVTVDRMGKPTAVALL